MYIWTIDNSKEPCYLISRKLEHKFCLKGGNYMAKELEQKKESGKEELLPHDRQIMVDSITRLIRQADIKKLNCIYGFALHIL